MHADPAAKVTSAEQRIQPFASMASSSLSSERHADSLPRSINFLVDGDIPTTAIVSGVLSRAFGDGNVVLKMAEQATYVDLCSRPTIFSRVCSERLSWLPAWMHKAGASYAYFLDDCFWQYYEKNDVADYYARIGVQRSLDEFITKATTVIVSSRHLADQLQQRYKNIEVLLVPAPFDFTNVTPRDAATDAITAPLRIGYAGSERRNAFQAVAQAICRILLQFPGKVEFEFIGYMPESLAGTQGVTHFHAIDNYRNFLSFKQSRRWDVGLAPLSENAFSRAKTNNKFREYGALSIAGVYSTVAPYDECVLDGVNGLLVGEKTDDWFDAFIFLLHNRDACRQMGINAYSDVWEHHRLDKVADAWNQLFVRVDLRPATGSVSTKFGWAMACYMGRVRERFTAYSALRDSKGTGELLAHIARRIRSLLAR